MKFVESFSLRRRGAVEQAEPVAIEGSLLVGEMFIGQWEDRSRASSYGHDVCRIYPAFRNGEKTFVITKDWIPARGYSAQGIEDEVLNLEDGIRLMIENGVYDRYFIVSHD